jgi:polyhydroxyalkanoate synthase
VATKQTAKSGSAQTSSPAADVQPASKTAIKPTAKRRVAAAKTGAKSKAAKPTGAAAKSAERRHSAVKARVSAETKRVARPKPKVDTAQPEASSASAPERAAHTARSGADDLASQASHNTLAVNPLIGLNGKDMLVAAKALCKGLSGAPTSTLKHYAGYLSELSDVLQGVSKLAPDPKDRRFSDPAWKSSWVYSRLAQVYLATQKALNDAIGESNLSAIEKGRAQFISALITDALAPTNFVLGNPAAVRKLVDTGGKNLVDGWRNLLHDIRYNNMMPSQVDAKPFKVGENMATSPGQVVFRHPMFELLQFSPTTPQVHARPLVMSPPQVNKYYAIDLGPEKSLIKWTVDSGVQMFVVSWRNPTLEHRDWSLEDYCMALDAAVDVAREITGSPDVNMWGSCSGGMTLAAYLGWLAARGDQKVVNTTWAVCVLNTEASLQDSTLGLFNTPATIKAAKARSRSKGLVLGEQMASMFAWLRPNDLIWNYWVNNYLLGNQPPALDILAWNADVTRLPGQYHCDLLDMVEKNPFINPGTLEIGGEKIDFRKVKLGAYVIGGITDHITPWRACYGTARLFGPETTFVLANAGHLQSMINPPGAPKSYFFSGKAIEDDPLVWAERAQANRQEGSWWPHWRAWMQQCSGPLMNAPSALGSKKNKPLGAAPGTYVAMK